MFKILFPKELMFSGIERKFSTGSVALLEEAQAVPSSDPPATSENLFLYS